MIMFPWVENLFKKLKEIGSPLFYIWAVVAGIVGGLAVNIWSFGSSKEALIMGGLFVWVWLIPWPFVVRYERKRKASRESKK
jgi:membrane protein YdbS with pleckstrin-like domain